MYFVKNLSCDVAQGMKMTDDLNVHFGGMIHQHHLNFSNWAI